MSLKPVIFLSFANDEDSYLSFLRQEEDAVYKSLQGAHDAGFIEVFNEGSATIDDIYSHFTRYRDRVVIFHYAGHAGGTKLHLEDQDANASGLAKLLGQQQNLKLVFLNGCSTKGQVQALLKHGVKAVIATSVPIQDRKAVEFATQFYDSLANKATIEQAFDESVSRLITEQKASELQIVIYRDRDILVGESLQEEDEMPWGLYVRDEEVLSWKLPSVDKSVFSDPWVGFKIESQDVNKHIVLPVFQAMADYNEAFAEQLKFYRMSNSPAMLDMLFRQMMDLIIKHFPWPIGIKLRTLFSSDDRMMRKSRGRLLGIISTYIRISTFLLYILLSQLWDELVSEKDGESKFKIKAAYQQEFEEFFNLNSETSRPYDFMRMMGRLTRIFAENQIKPFIEQFDQLHQSVEKQAEFYTAYIYLEGVREKLENGQVEEGEIPELCDKCEYSLGVILKECAFLVTYQLVSIKDIGVSSLRRKEPKFKHQIGVLAGVAIEVMEGTPKDYGSFTNSHSILLIKGIEEVSQNLNLSPFIIDENAFKGINTPKIYLYSFNTGFESFFYTHVDNDGIKLVPELMTSEDKYPYLKELFEMFKADLINSFT